MSEAVRSHWSDLRVEPFMEPPGTERSDAGGPLAELARLVGQDDPFQAVFRKTKAPAVAAPEAFTTTEDPNEVRLDQASTRGAVAEAELTGQPDDLPAELHALGLRPSYDDDGEWAAAHREPDHWDHRQPHGDHGAGDAPDDYSAEMQGDAPHYAAPPMTPDLWAEEGEPEAFEPTRPVLSDETSSEPKATRRPLVVLAAVLALTGGGLAATVLARSGSSAAVYTAGMEAPTIMAATGPTKIKQNDGAGDTTPEDADAALLNKNGASSGGPVKVVNSQEQPIDLAQLPKATNAQSDAASAPSSPFPTPKKVKTFLVRPDGSLVTSAPGGGSSAPRPIPQLAAGGVPGGDGADPAASPAAGARPSTPKADGHAATTPKTISDAIGAVVPESAPAKDKSAVSAIVKPAAKPVQMAEASVGDATATTGPGGNFALQLAASPSEQDAHAAFVKLQKKYTELGGYKPTVKKVDNGQKTMYRLRVGNLSQDQAKTLCSKLQDSGGSCFVVRN